MTEIVMSSIARGVGRKQINHEVTPLRLPKGTLARVDALLADKEKRAEFLRAAVEAEVERRERDRPEDTQ